jgi:tetratricopeptide (TPR) repeat protein
VIRRLVLVTLLWASTTLASPSDDLQRARESFIHRDWQSTITKAYPLVYPEVQLGTQDETVEAHLLLGGSHYELNNKDQAQNEFRRALELDPDREITTAVFSQGAVKLFDEMKGEIQRRAAEAEERRKLAEKIKQLQDYEKNLVKVEVHNFALNFAPLGAGQFQNRERRKGLLFLGGQGLTLATSLGTWYYLVNKYGLSSTHVPQKDVNTVNRLEQIEVGAGIAFFTLWAWSVVDGIWHYKPEVRIKGPALSPLLQEELQKQKPPPPAKTSFHIGPMLTPNSVGIGLSWETP